MNYPQQLKDLDNFDRIDATVSLGLAEWDWLLAALPDDDEVTKRIRKAVRKHIQDSLVNIFWYDL